MIANFFSLFERLKNKWLRYYRLKVFEAYTGQKTENCLILGPITLINRNVRVGRNVTFYPNVMLWGDGPINIGNNVDIGYNTVIYAKKQGGVSIGCNTSIAAHCYIIDSNHGTKATALIQDQPMDTNAIEIGNDVWIATDVTVLKGSKIEDGAVIGAKSLVNRPMGADVISFGIPAHPHRKRRD